MSIRVLLPAARMTAFVEDIDILKTLKTARPKKLPGQDSNLEREYQKLLCYLLHHRVIVAGFGPKGVYTIAQTQRLLKGLNHRRFGQNHRGYAVNDRFLLRLELARRVRLSHCHLPGERPRLKDDQSLG